MLSEEKKEINKQRIIDASTRLFIQQGISATTLLQVAKESDVVCRTVSNIFGSKCNLVLEDLRCILKQIMEPVYSVIETPDYKALSGLEQVLYITRVRGEALFKSPDTLLIISEIKVWLARSYHDEKPVKIYMDNLESLYRIIKDSIDKGIADGTINPKVDMKQAQSMLGPSFRAVLQQLAQVKMNPEFSKVVDVSEQLEIQLAVLRAGLKNYKNTAT